MKVLIIMHAASEGPGTLGDFFQAREARMQTVRLYQGESLPADPRDYDIVVSMGGPMGVYDEDQYPFLKAETDFLRRTVESAMPLLGICLGAQMIAKACGAVVGKSPLKELGLDEIELTPEGRRDPLFKGLPDKIPVVQCHEDMFAVPVGGTWLASSPACPYQAFRMRSAYGLQFHVEASRAMLTAWFHGAKEEQSILAEFDRRQDALNALAQKIYSNFLALR